MYIKVISVNRLMCDFTDDVDFMMMTTIMSTKEHKKLRIIRQINRHYETNIRMDGQTDIHTGKQIDKNNLYSCMFVFQIVNNANTSNNNNK